MRDNRYFCGYIYLIEADSYEAPTRACYWPSLTECRVLGTLGGQSSLAFAARDSNHTKNNRPELVGASEVYGSTHPRAFVYNPDQGMRDLNSLIPAGTGWVLEVAFDIDYRGRIVGKGTLNGQTRGFILIPVSILNAHASPSVLKGYQTGVINIEMMDAVPSDTRITVSASNTAVKVPASVTIPKGESRYSFAFVANPVRQQTAVDITLTLSEQTVPVRVTVTP